MAGDWLLSDGVSGILSDANDVAQLVRLTSLNLIVVV